MDTQLIVSPCETASRSVRFHLVPLLQHRPPPLHPIPVSRPIPLSRPSSPAAGVVRPSGTPGLVAPAPARDDRGACCNERPVAHCSSPGSCTSLSATDHCAPGVRESARPSSGSGPVRLYWICCRRHRRCRHPLPSPLVPTHRVKRLRVRTNI